MEIYPVIWRSGLAEVFLRSLEIQINRIKCHVESQGIQILEKSCNISMVYLFRNKCLLLQLPTDQMKC